MATIRPRRRAPENGSIAQRGAAQPADDKDFALTKKRKELIVDARHVLNAISRDQVKDVTNRSETRAGAQREGGQEVRRRGPGNDWRELSGEGLEEEGSE
jgi:hypothetical protein